MKKAAFLFFLISVLGTTLSAQSTAYIPMLGKQSSGWFEYIDPGFLYGGPATLMIYQAGDTLVRGQTYTRLKYDKHSYAKDTTYAEYVFFLREDTTQRKVYFLERGGNSEFPFYDFSKKPGDIVVFGQWSMLLNSIDHTVSVCGGTIQTENRVFHFTNFGNDLPITWVEGVGAVSGLIWFYDETDFDCKLPKHGLICKMTDYSSVYHFDKFSKFKNCPFQLTSSNQQKPEELAIRLYPNPLNSILQISGDPGELGHARYRIFNLTGQMLKTGIFDYSQETLLNVSSLPEGVYIIEIFNANKNLLTNKKFIVAK